MSNSKSSAQQATTNARESQCNESEYCYKDEKGNFVCLDLSTEDGRKKAKEHAHLNRNQFQQGVCPTNLSQISEESGDVSTGIIWSPAGNVGKLIQWYKGYHQAKWKVKMGHDFGYGEEGVEVEAVRSEDCYRGVIPPKERQALKDKCEFRQSAKALGENPDDLEPGFQCCYYPEGHPQAGQLSASSSFDFHSPEGYSQKHIDLDVYPHNELGGNYKYGDGMSSGKDIQPMSEEQMEKQKAENLKVEREKFERDIETQLRKYNEELGSPGPPPKPLPKPE